MNRFHEQVMGVYFDDLDAFRILHNARYLLLFERTLGSFWEHVGLPYDPMLHGDHHHLVRANTIEYLAPVRGTGKVRVRVWVERIGRTSLTFAFRMMPLDADSVYAEGTRTIVRIDPAKFAARAVERRLPEPDGALDAGADVIVALAAAAWAQDDEPAPPPQNEPPASEEIVVYGQLAVQKARDAIVREMERLGYHVRGRKEGRIILAPPADWMGAAILEPDGSFTFRSPLMAAATVPEEFYTLDVRHEDPTAGQIKASEVQPEVGIGAGASFPSKRKRDLVRARVLEETADEVEAYRRILAKTKEQGEPPADPGE